MAPPDGEGWIKGACPQDCPDTCALLYRVEAGRLAEVRGNPAHPFTRGQLCVKLKDWPAHHANPDRLLFPMRRVGAKGDGRFERISWADALSEIAGRWRALIEAEGPQAVLPCSYLGHEGLLNGLNSGDAFFNRLGATIAERTFCASGLVTAWMMTLGPSTGLDPESFAEAKLIVLWAANPASTSQHHWPFLLQARKRGARIVVIDPLATRSARQADWHIRPRPGTDAALALAMMQVIVAEGLVDRDYVDRFTLGYAALAERAEAWPPERAAAVTGVPAEEIRAFARAYATTQPAAIRLGVALERHRNGGQAVRVVCCLPALVGAWRHPGGGVMGQTDAIFPLRLEAQCRPDWIRPGTRVINLNRLGRALAGAEPPVRSLMVWNANPAVQAPDAALVRRGLAREDLFTVVSEHFLTDTARHADILLPAAMQAEQRDLMYSWGHFYFTWNEPAVAPAGEAVSNSELFRRLAAAMGFDDEQFRLSDETMIERFVDWRAPSLEGIGIEDLRRDGFARLRAGPAATRAPHAEGGFPTPSGRCHLALPSGANAVLPAYRQMHEGDQPVEAIDPVPDYLPPAEALAADAPPPERFPLGLVTPKAHCFINSQYANEPTQLSRQGPRRLAIHPDDAAPRGIATGDLVEVWNDRGRFRARAKVGTEVPPGLLAAEQGHWSAEDAGVNAVASDRFADLGNAPTFSDLRVEVVRV